MWIEKTPSGKFKYVEQYTDYMTGKKKRVSVTLEKNTASAKRTALETLTRMIESRQSEPTENKDITENGTLNEHRSRLFALLHWGYENDYVKDVSFLHKVKPFKDVSHKEKIQDKYLEPEEVKQLLNAMRTEKWKLFTKFLVLSGLRIGEAVALTKEDVDFENHVIRVNKNYDPNNEVVTTPKTLSSIREVYMQPDLETVTRSMFLYTKIEGMENGHRSDLFIANKKGTHINYYSYNKYLKENAIRVLDRSITAHALRHTHASLLLAQGIDVDTIARRLGHENSKITKEIYLHITKQLKERDNEQIQKIRML